MKNNNKKYFLFEDEEVETSSKDSGDDSLPPESGESGLEPEHEKILTQNVLSSTAENTAEKEESPVDGFDINMLAERVADAVEFRKFIRTKGRL